MTSPKTPNRLSGRNKTITAASIGAVGLASVFAIGANLGILSSTDQDKVGAAVAAGDLISADAPVVDVYLDEQGDPLAQRAAASAGSQRFTVDSAGTVDVSVDGGSARADLVSPADGWTATPTKTTGTGVSVTFTDGARTLEFTATVGPDGTVTGDVTEATIAAPDAPAVAPGAATTAAAGAPAAPAPAAAPGAPAAPARDEGESAEHEDESGDDEYEDEDEDEDGSDQEFESEDQEYEGGDSDD